MPNITTCTHCGKLYEASSEETANERVRLCPTCQAMNDLCPVCGGERHLTGCFVGHCNHGPYRIAGRP